MLPEKSLRDEILFMICEQNSKPNQII